VVGVGRKRKDTVSHNELQELTCRNLNSKRIIVLPAQNLDIFLTYTLTPILAISQVINAQITKIVLISLTWTLGMVRPQVADGGDKFLHMEDSCKYRTKRN
jgi:hypothetical protein